MLNLFIAHQSNIPLIQYSNIQSFFQPAARSQKQAASLNQNPFANYLPSHKYHSCFFRVIRGQTFFCGQFFPEAPKTRKFNFDLKSIDLSEENIKLFDVVVLTTDYSDFDYDLFSRESNLIVDTRGKFRNMKKVIKA